MTRKYSLIMCVQIDGTGDVHYTKLLGLGAEYGKPANGFALTKRVESPRRSDPSGAMFPEVNYYSSDLF